MGSALLALGTLSVGLGLGATEGGKTAVLLLFSVGSVVALFVPSVRALLPDRQRQVRVKHMRSRPARAAAEWGFDLGTGVLTHYITPAFYAFLGVAVAQASPEATFGVTVMYGLARGTAIAGLAVRYSHLDDSSAPALRGLYRRSPTFLAFLILVATAAVLS